MQPMIFPADPNFMQKKRAVLLTAVQVVFDASILAPRRSHQRPQLRLQQRFLPFARFQQNNERDRVLRQLTGLG